MLANTVNQIAIAIAIAAVVVVARCQNGLEEKQKMTTFPRRGACSKGDAHGALHSAAKFTQHAARFIVYVQIMPWLFWFFFRTAQGEEQVRSSCAWSPCFHKLYQLSTYFSKQCEPSQPERSRRVFLTRQHQTLLSGN